MVVAAGRRRPISLLELPFQSSTRARRSCRPARRSQDARLAPEQGSDVLGREGAALGVGEHDRDAPLHLAGKKFRVASAESAPSVVAVRFQFTGGGWSMPPTARASPRTPRCRASGTGAEAAGRSSTRSSSGNLAELAADLTRRRPRSLEPRSRGRRPRGDHRARDVDHEEDLGVGARDVLRAAVDDRLHGAEPEERRHATTLATSIPRCVRAGVSSRRAARTFCVRRSPWSSSASGTDAASATSPTSGLRNETFISSRRRCRGARRRSRRPAPAGRHGRPRSSAARRASGAARSRG